MKKILLLTSFILALSVSCTKDFHEINENPNFPTVDEANPALLLPKILFQVGNEMTASMAWGTGNILAQLVSTNNFTGTDRYLLGSYTGTWDLLYRNLRDANNLKLIGESINNTGYQGAALTLRAWMLANLTEMYGDVPYSEALKGKENLFTPTYDQQIDIYKNILSDLDMAIELFDGTSTMNGDILYGSDHDQWKKLAHSLKFRYIMRLEKKWGEMGINGPFELQSILDGGIHFTGNGDNAGVSYLAGTNRWPLNTARVGSFDEKRMSQTIETTLKGLNDPRMEVLFRPVDNPDSDEFIGVPNGLSEDAASNFNGGANNQSRLGTRFREDPASVEMIIMHYSELMFLVAEASQKGYVNADMTAAYNAGVSANMNYLGINDTQDYLDQSSVALGSNDLEKIAMQKWISLFMVGNEAWYDFRRTGLPNLVPGPNAVIAELPSRFLYPSDEQVLNGDNYDAVISRQGADDITTKMWLLK